MTYIDEIADAIADRVPADATPETDTALLFRLYALLALLRGADVRCEDVHDAWAVWMSGQDPNHPSLRPFAEIPPDKQAADEPFAQAIRDVASDIASRRR